MGDIASRFTDAYDISFFPPVTILLLKKHTYFNMSDENSKSNSE